MKAERGQQAFRLVRMEQDQKRKEKRREEEKRSESDNVFASLEGQAKSSKLVCD